MKFFSTLFSRKTSLKKRILANTSWLLADKAIRLLVGLFVIAWLARYLGPEKFGIYSYALALIAIFVPLGKLGLDTIVVRDVVRNNHATEEILGTAFIAKLLGGFLAAILSVITIMLIKPGDHEIWWLVLILSLMIVFPALDVIDFWFQTKLRSKNVVIARDVAFLVASLGTIVFLAYKGPLLAFAGMRSLELGIAAVCLLFAYRISGNEIKSWKFSKSILRNLLSDSWPLIFAGIAAMLYMRIDQVMLGQMIGNKVVGEYSAAIRITEIFYFLPVALVKSSFPAIVRSKEVSAEVYNRRIQKLCSFLVLMSYLIAIPMTFMSSFVIGFVFGSKYVASGPVLAVYIWAVIFVFLGVAKRAWITTEGLMKFTFFSTTMGAILNILLNVFFIRVWGMLGAAYATLISQGIASVFMNAIFAKTRPIFMTQMKSAILIGLFRKPGNIRAAR